VPAGETRHFSGKMFAPSEGGGSGEGARSALFPGGEAAPGIAPASGRREYSAQPEQGEPGAGLRGFSVQRRLRWLVERELP
jgi:hypothetical protein